MPERGLPVSLDDLAAVPTRAGGGLPLPGALRLGVMVALGWAALTPVRRVPVPPAPGEGVALMVVLDVSSSMARRDPGGRTLLETARESLERFLAGREGDAVGLVTFAADATVVVPPMTARGGVADALERLEGGEVEGGGTALGDALGLAAHRLRSLDVRSRVVVVVSDGGSNSGALDPLTAARSAAALGQVVYVLGLGDPGQGNPLLQRVATEGGGRVWWVDEREALDAAWAELDALEPSRLPGEPLTARAPGSRWPLAWALALLLAERLLRASRRGAVP